MENWKENIICFIEKIGNLNFQYDVWVKGLFWDRVVSFGEAINTLEDYCFFEKIENKSIRFEDEKLQINLIDFSANLLSYQEPENVEEMLRDEEWLNIVKQAKNVHSNSDLLILEE